jgi:signal transduction histidine kinase/ligand-binding sensor domain-containing protein
VVLHFRVRTAHAPHDTCSASRRMSGLVNRVWSCISEQVAERLHVPGLGRIRFLQLIALLVALTCSASWALDRDRSLGQLHHTAWYASNGAPTDVWALAQTSDGWLWLGGPAGLYRFDGVTFERVDENPHDPGEARAISAFFALESGGLLIGYVHGGASILRDGHFTHYGASAGLGSATIFSFAQDADGTLWAATRSGLMRLDGAHWHRIGDDADLPDGYTSDVFSENGGGLLVAVKDEILRRPPGSRKFQRAATIVGQASFIQSLEGSIWYLDNAGAHALPKKEGAATRGQSVNSRASYMALFDRDGSFWSVMQEGVGHIVDPHHGRTSMHLKVPSAYVSSVGKMLKLEGTKTILEDREGNIWITTTMGIHRFRNTNIVQLPQDTTREVLIAGLASDDNGGMWMVVRNSSFAVAPNDGVWRFDRGLSHIQPKEIPWATAVHRAKDGHIWIGGQYGLWRYDGKRFSKALDLPPSTRGQFIHCITDDPDGNVWVSVVGGGLFRHRAGVWQRNGNFPQFPAEAPLTQARDPKGRVWFGYGNNIVIALDGERVTTFTAAEGLDIGPVTSLAVGRHTLVGGERGLAIFRDGRFVPLKANDPLAFQGIKGIVETGNGDVWLNGVRGAVRIPASAMQDANGGSGSAMEVEVFDSNEGYPGAGAGANPYPQPKIALATDGRIWLATSGGTAWIDPRRIQRNLVPPVVVLRSLTASGQRHDATTRVSLAGGTRNLQIDYTALSYSQPDRLRFRYRLQGNDDGEWVDAGPRRQAFYTNLGPGNYRFEVNAANASGIWSTVPATLDFAIPPTFTQTRTFLAICFAAAIGVLLLAYALRERQLLARARSRLEARLAERERIARELHDTLLQSTQGLILRFQAAANRIPKGDPARAALDATLERADEVIAEGRNRVLDLRVPAETLDELPEALAAAGNDLARGRELTFRTVVEGTVRALVPIVHDEIYRIGREALVNAFAHANASTIEVQIIYVGADLRLRIRDDGRGIARGTLEEGALPGHWGLVGMRERAQKIGAQLDIWSGHGAGTEIELRIPASEAYAGQRTRSLWPRLRLLGGGIE